jgi:hypothetical protein
MGKENQMNKITHKIEDVSLTVRSLGRIDPERRTVYRYTLKGPWGSFSEQDLKSGCQGGDLKEGMSSLIAFLSAAGESYPYGENAELFPAAISIWAKDHQDDLFGLSLEYENRG